MGAGNWNNLGKFEQAKKINECGIGGGGGEGWGERGGRRACIKDFL